MSSLTPEQAAEVRAIVAEMVGQALRGVQERITGRICEAQSACDVVGCNSPCTIVVKDGLITGIQMPSKSQPEGGSSC